MAASTSPTYTFIVRGTKAGTYGLDVTFKNGYHLTTFKAKDIPTLPGEVHRYIVDKKEPDGMSVTLHIDRNGNGETDRTLRFGTNLTGSVYDEGATPAELKASAIGDIN